jgi:hypothetical protein
MLATGRFRGVKTKLTPSGRVFAEYAASAEEPI